MRRLALPAAALVLSAATAVPVFAEVTRTLRVEVPSPTTTHWAIENLAGSICIDDKAHNQMSSRLRSSSKKNWRKPAGGLRIPPSFSNSTL